MFSLYELLQSSKTDDSLHTSQFFLHKLYNINSKTVANILDYYVDCPPYNSLYIEAEKNTIIEWLQWYKLCTYVGYSTFILYFNTVRLVPFIPVIFWSVRFRFNSAIAWNYFWYNSKTTLSRKHFYCWFNYAINPFFHNWHYSFTWGVTSFNMCMNRWVATRWGVCEAVAMWLHRCTWAKLGCRQPAPGRLQQLQLRRRSALLHQPNLCRKEQLHLELVVQLGLLQCYLWGRTENTLQVRSYKGRVWWSCDWGR